MSAKSKWHLYLDEEGYPVMEGGIRAEDPEFLQMVFKNLGREAGDDRTPLITQMQHKTVWVTSFDDPLVSQGIEIKGQKSLWKFLGTLDFEVPLSEILVDEWHRFHAYVGGERIPAVMSRKAQAQFLNALPEPETFNPAAYRKRFNSVDWDSAYKTSETPWNVGDVNPTIAGYSQNLLRDSGKVFLVPGAGHGFEAVFLEGAGKNVIAIDQAPTALETFRNLHKNSNVKYWLADFFNESLMNFSEPFDGILENNFLVALNPSLRSQVVARYHSLLKPGGYLAGSFFLRMSEQGPPYGLSEWELREHTKDKFEIVEWIRSKKSHPAREGMELWALLKKLD